MYERTKTFREILRQTTRKPLLIHPLLWDSPHLDALHLSIKSGPCPETKSLNQEKHLPVGSIDREGLKLAWLWAPLDTAMVDYYFPDILVSIIDTVQEPLVKRPFEVHITIDPFAGQRCHLTFSFDNIFKLLRPQLLLTTTTDIPFLAYSGPRYKKQLRDEFSLRTRTQFRKILYDFRSTDYDETIDPYDLACLIAMAQEQRLELSPYPKAAHIDIFTVYLLSPATNTFAFELFTARISKRYLDALENTSLEIFDDLIITKEIIGLPDEDSKKLDEGILVDRIGEILEHACVYHQIIVDGYYEKARIRAQRFFETAVESGE